MPHIHELYDFTVSFFIVHDGKVLLVNHPRYNKWICPGGHIELNEEPDEALFREIEEETGLEVEILSNRPETNTPGTTHQWTPNYVDTHEANPPHRHIALIYFARSTNNKSRLSDEHTDMRWFSEADLENEQYGLAEATKFYCREALKLAA